MASRIATRPPVKQEFILHDLRRQIVKGALPPKSQLPTRAELEQQYQVSSTTLQRALDQLIDEGFVKTLGPKGTFVAERPPHLSNYALLFPSSPATLNNDWRRFWGALLNEGQWVRDEQEKNVQAYFDIREQTDSSDYRKLVEDMRAHRVAGLIFASPPWKLVGTPLIEEPGIPRVAITGNPGVDKGVSAVALSQESFARKAMEYLAAQRCRHVAVIKVPGMDPRLFQREADRLRLDLRQYWIQSVSPSFPEAARNCAHLLMNPGQSVRPDGLIIADDNLVEYATTGLVDAGARVPEDARVVAHCNFPWPTPSVLQVRRLGYDARQVLAICIDSIDRQRRGEKVPQFTSVEAVFEDEAARG